MKDGNFRQKVRLGWRYKEKMWRNVGGTLKDSCCAIKIGLTGQTL